MDNKRELLEMLGCKNIQHTLKYLESLDFQCEEHRDIYEHIQAFYEATGHDGDDCIFFAQTSCDQFCTWMHEIFFLNQCNDIIDDIKEICVDYKIDFDEIEYIHYIDGTIHLYGRNAEGYLHTLN